jgi:DNA-binding transcriptional LysR family regulator
VSEKLHLSAAAVHKQLKQLESELEVALYEKVGRTLKLTQAAEVLLPYTKDLLAQHDAAITAIQEWKGLKRGVVRIGAGPTISSYVLPGLLKKFRRAFPKVDLFVETGNSVALLQSLGNGSLDLALLVSSQLPEEPNVCIEVSWDVELVLVSNLRQAPRRCPISSLSKFPFILFQKGSRLETLIERYFAELNFRPTVIMTFDNAEAIKAMIRAGLGIALLPFWIVDADLRKGSLSIIRQRERPLFTKIDLVSRKSSYRPGPVDAFIGLARKFECKNPRLTSTSTTGRK